MADTPYLLLLEVVLTGNGTGSISFPVPNGETLEIYDLRFVATGAFNITDIRNSSGEHYTNASASIEIISTLVQNAGNANLGLQPFIIPLVINGSQTFYIDFEDTSGSGNTVTLLFNCVRKRS